jgi:hypothetical protein
MFVIHHKIMAPTTQLYNVADAEGLTFKLRLKLRLSWKIRAHSTVLELHTMRQAILSF